MSTTSPELMILLACIGAGLLLVLARGRWLGAVPERRRRLKRGPRGEVVAIGEVSVGEPLTLRGTGPASSDFKLNAGDYRLRYTFPSGSVVKVDLVSLADAERETLVLKSGSGEVGFTLASPGRYRLEIDPADEGAAWEITCEPMRVRSAPQSEL